MIVQDHHVISRNLSENMEILRELSRRGLYDLEAPENKIKLPADRTDAEKSNKSPHNGKPLDSYEKKGMQDRLKAHEDSEDFKKMKGGDDDAANRLKNKVDDLRDAGLRWDYGDTPLNWSSLSNNSTLEVYYAVALKS